jgi:hypothetical protein
MWPLLGTDRDCRQRPSRTDCVTAEADSNCRASLPIRVKRAGRPELALQFPLIRARCLCQVYAGLDPSCWQYLVFGAADIAYDWAERRPISSSDREIGAGALPDGRRFNWTDPRHPWVQG